MKRITISILLLTLFVQSSMPDYPTSLDKKITKQISRLWKTVEIKKEVLHFKDSTLNIPDRSFYRLTSQDSLVGIMVINKAKGCHVGGCDGDGQNQMYEYFYYMVIYNPDLTIKNVKVLQYEPEYGYEIAAKRWLRKFIGTNGCELRYGHEIDAISGATISGLSIVADVNNLCYLMEGMF